MGIPAAVNLPIDLLRPEWLPGGAPPQRPRKGKARPRAGLSPAPQVVVPARPTGGGWRKGLVAEEKTGWVGVGIVAFHGLDMVKRAVTSVLKFAKPKYDILVFDNSEDMEVGEWMTSHCSTVGYMKSPKNIGCWNARNRIAEHFAAKGIEHFIIQDQDVEWAGDAVVPMLDVFQHYEDTAVVSWKLALKQMGGGKHKTDKTGALTPSESPGMCCMYSIRTLAAGDDPGLVGWHHGYGLVYRGDSDYCLSMWKKGFKTRVVMEGAPLVRHAHPHSTMKRLPWLARERAVSSRVFAERRKKYGFPRI